MRFVELPEKCVREMKAGNHSARVVNNGNLVLCKLFTTVIAKVNIESRVIATDRSYGTPTTKKSCTQYENYYIARGYKQVDWDDKRVCEN